jgi:hypothetical protein
MTTVLSLSIGLTKFPSNLDIAELVRVGGMALLRVDKDTREVTGTYCAEGLFNGCASYIFNKEPEMFIEVFKKWIFGKELSLLSVGEIGEVLNRILIVQAASKAARSGFFKEVGRQSEVPQKRNISESIFEPIALEDFLDAYCGTDARIEYMDAAPDELAGSFLAFSHFYTMGIDWVNEAPYDVAANALSRGAGVVPRPYAKGCDCLIPLALQNGALSFIYFQTKIGSSYVGHPDEAKVFSCSPHHAFKLGDDPKPYVFIYHHLSHPSEPLSSLVVTSNSFYPCLSLRGVYNNDFFPRPILCQNEMTHNAN